MNECSNQQALGIIMFAYPLEVRNFLFRQLVFELQLFDVAVTKEFTDHLCPVNILNTDVYMDN